MIETGKVGLGMSSETRQTIHGLLVSLHKVKPNQSVRSLLSGDAGSVVAALIGFSGAPEDSDSLRTASLVVKLEDEGLVAYDPDLGRVVIQPSATSSDSATVASETRSSDSSNVTSSTLPVPPP